MNREISAETCVFIRYNNEKQNTKWQINLFFRLLLTLTVLPVFRFEVRL